MEHQKLQAVFLAHRDALLRFLNARGAGDNAEDVLQDLWLKLSDVDDSNIVSPLPYLYRAANNAMHDRYRKDERARQRDNEWSDVNRGTGEASDLPPPDRALIANQQLASVEARISKEGPRVFTIFRRFRVDGIGQRKIAEEMGISLSAVEKDLQKAYRALVDWQDREGAE
ncbi:RNA polymerase sigma factor [Parasphingorhabdus cellanae]|uniref:Sigma-70 family RNA polymerase sigma factor n=1 Tax=Parasphingorhabdus cellanae TaxID=2806553 RepID=A0ABX7T0Y9_9SPHN|nr:sigma-70 family RNA polymerase sigma factor [Parasphingorhabdus cellanae]QTD55216.1 sigma-70 family RNA polymerase sigma factor [Parasphingorhabdus cellanae]